MGDRRLRSLVRQMLLSEEYDRPYEPEAPADAPLGKYAFAGTHQASGLRQRLQGPIPPWEKNNAVELKLLGALQLHFEVGNRALPYQYASQIMELIRNGLYSDIFAEPSIFVTAHRGIAVNSASILKWMPDNMMSSQILNAPFYKETDIDVNIDITNFEARETSSWSKSKQAAQKFAIRNVAKLNPSQDESVYAIVMCADVEENPLKFIDASPLYWLRDFHDYRDEQEIIGIGTVRVNKLYVTRHKRNEL
jgi:hypothetical protein